MKAFCEKVKGKISSDEYLYLLKYFQEYNNGRIEREGLIDMVNDLLKEYSGFFDEFLRVFTSIDCLPEALESVEKIDKKKKFEFKGVGESNSFNKKIRLSSNLAQKPNLESISKNKLVQALEFCEKIKKNVSCEEYLELLKCLHDYGTGKITITDLKITMANSFLDFMDDFSHILELNVSLTQPSSEFQKDIEKKEKKPSKNKNTRHLDELTPSYEFLPKHSNGTKEIDKEVLNSCCRISKHRYNEIPSTAVWLKDPHEKMLNKNEDELFERDMLTGWIESTKTNATDLYKAIKDGEIQKPTLEDVKSKLTSFNLILVEKMYAEFGPLVVNQLLHSPEAVLPVLIDRLNKMESPSRGIKM